jgi:hypothetical protein
MKSLHRLQIYGATEQKHMNWLYKGKYLSKLEETEKQLKPLDP